MFGTGDFGEPRIVVSMTFTPFYIADNRPLITESYEGAA